MPASPMLAVRWALDFWLLDQPPVPLWSLPPEVAEEVRWILVNVTLPVADE